MKVRTAESRQAYKDQRNFVNVLKKQSTKDMWTNIGRDLENDVRGTKKLLYSMAKGYKNRVEDKPKNASIKSSEGDTITGNDKVTDRCLEYFEDLLNIDDGISDHEGNVPDDDISLDDSLHEDPITTGELEAAIKLTKDNKAPGPDEVPVETIKAGGEPLKAVMLDLMNLAWSSGIVCTIRMEQIYYMCNLQE